MGSTLGGKTAIAGIGATEFSKNSGRSELQLAAEASIPVEYNLTPKVGLRVAPEFYMTGFGATEQKSLGFTIGMVYRLGKQ